MLHGIFYIFFRFRTSRDHFARFFLDIFPSPFRSCMAAFSFVFYIFRYVVSVCNIFHGELLRLIIIAQLSLGEKYSLYFWFVLKMSTLNSTFFHVFIVLPFCTIRSPFYCIFSLLGSAVVRLPLLPASHAPCIRCYASCFTSSLNNSPAEW